MLWPPMRVRFLYGTQYFNRRPKRAKDGQETGKEDRKPVSDLFQLEMKPGVDFLSLDKVSMSSIHGTMHISDMPIRSPSI